MDLYAYPLSPVVAAAGVLGLAAALPAVADATTAVARPEGDTHRAMERLHEAQRIGQIGDGEFDLADATIGWSPQV